MPIDPLAALRGLDPAERAERLAALDREANAEAIRKGREAESALRLLDPHFAALRDVALREIVSSAPDQLAFRERMIVTCQILDAVHDALAKCCVSGHDAMHRDILSQTVSLRR